jgi:uncharacterized Tic20 family protein
VGQSSSPSNARQEKHPMSLAEELQKLQELHQSGAINSEEFSRAKAKVLGSQAEGSVSPSPEAGGASVRPQEEQTRQWAMFLHLSLLAGFVVPIAGLVAPIVIWQLKKTELPGIDVHGKNALNWIISDLIYVIVGVILIFAIIGIPLLFALAIVSIIFPVIAAIKANNGEVWKYPMSITIIK